MVVFEVPVNGCNPVTIVLGRRGTYNTQEVTFDLSYLVENYGAGTAVLMVKRSQDTSAYPAVVSQESNTLTWGVSDVDTFYPGSGECELMWYVDEGLAKTIIYPMVVMRDILQTTEEPPDGYENWIEHLTELGEETQQNAQDAAQSASEAKASEDSAAESAQRAEDAAGLLVDVSATATTLDPGQPATAEYNDGVFEFGIPKGDKLTYADLTEADKEDLVQGPIKDAQDDAVEAVGTAKTNAVDAVNQAGTTQKNAVNQAGTTQKNAVTQEGTTQVNTVREAGTTQVGRVTTEGNTQVGRVQAKGDEVIASIPSDYSDLVDDVADLTRQLSDKQDYYLYTLSGSIATFDDAISGSPIQAITVSTKEAQTGEGNPSLTNVKPITCPTDLTINQSGADTSSPTSTVVDWSNTEAPLGIGTLHYNGDGTWTLKTLQVLVSVTYSFFSSAADIGIDSHNEVYIRNAFYNAGNGVIYRNRSRKSGGYKCTSNAFQVHFLNNSSHYASQNRLYLVNNGGWTSKNEFLADVQAYYNNGGTVQFLYEPTDKIPTFTLTTAEIFALTGTNNIWTTEDISVTYRIDVMDKINDIENRLDVVEAPAVDVIKSNEDAINKIWASRWLRSAAANPLTLLWFSDIHRWQENLNRIIEFKNYLNSLGILDDTIVTGDLVRNAASEGSTFTSFWQGTVGTEDILVALGNHDHYAKSETPHGRATFEVLDGLFFDRIDNWGVTRESNYPFYYKDYPEQNIRLIVADAFVKSSEADEETWLNSVLAGAKTKDYAVVIATHYLKLNSSSETTSVEILDNNWSNNLARTAGTTTMDYEGTDTDIVKCVTSFINGNGKFLCYMIGHTHTDIVSHPTGHPEQLIINCACASDDRSHETPLTTNDLPRYNGTRTKDCFNVITFDGVNQIIKCVRVGANVTMYQQPRTAFGYDVVNHQFISLI